jgi:hypothetical protein
MRKAGLARLLADQVEGVFIAENEQGEIGDALFRVACNMGLEGIVRQNKDDASGLDASMTMMGYRIRRTMRQDAGPVF